LTCRNTLMYFNTETQARILDRFHFALHEKGFMVLGKAETLLAYNSGFAAVDLKRRVFAKLNRGDLRDRGRSLLARNGGDEGVNHLISHVRIRETAFDAAPVAQLVVDTTNVLALANERARTLFGLNPADLGRPLQDLQVSYRPVELRGHLDRIAIERRPVQLKEVEWANPAGEIVFFDVQIIPLLDHGGSVIGVSVAFQDVTGFRRLQADLQRSNRELETAYEELQSTNEELETTNEELQSTVEELETTNEELQSTNEELETMNEELQSTNEELETLNEELSQRSEELNEVNSFLESILGSLREGVVVVDRDFLVRIWNHRAEDLWGLRSDEVRGKNLLNLDIGLPVEQLKQPIRVTMSDGGAYQEVVLDAVNRRGKAMRCRVSCNPLTGAGDLRRGAILMMGEADSSRPSNSDQGRSA
jgi:two-component system CheB/CheR fusion protein